MADFCKQCAEEMDFYPDYTDLFKDDESEPDGGESGFTVLCEGCGPAFIVDDEGTCAANNCLKEHGKEA